MTPPHPTPMGWLRETQRLSDASIEKAITEEISVELDDEGGEATVYNYTGEPSEYTVSYSNEIVSACSCPHHEYRDVICKHMVKCALELEKRREDG